MRSLVCCECGSVICDFSPGKCSEILIRDPLGLYHNVRIVVPHQRPKTQAMASLGITWFPGFESKLNLCPCCEEVIGWEFNSSTDRICTYLTKKTFDLGKTPKLGPLTSLSTRFTNFKTLIDVGVWPL